MTNITIEPSHRVKLFCEILSRHLEADNWGTIDPSWLKYIVGQWSFDAEDYAEYETLEDIEVDDVFFQVLALHRLLESVFAEGGVIVGHSPFKTEHLGSPIAPAVLRHNVYVAGWEHGAADFRQSVAWFDQMRALGLAEEYEAGRADGANARGRAFEKARTLKVEKDTGTIARAGRGHWESLDAEQRLVLELAHSRRKRPSTARFKGHRRATAEKLRQRTPALLELDVEAEDPQFVRTHLGDQVFDSASVAERITWSVEWKYGFILVMHSKLDPCDACGAPGPPGHVLPGDL